MSPARTRTAFRVIAVVEALTWVGLLIGMYYKYIAATTELGVRIFGSLHGAAFIVYLGVVLLVRQRFAWGNVVTLVALACSVPPFASLVFEVWAERTGRLRVEREVEADAHPAPAAARQG
jgi:integral membrane protein